uniref:CHCH domain-containing protein n=1 Tax=Nothoprocta perdicaria TaxID=30464 RepID=A0A8C6YX89_NOTPE
MAGAGHPGHRWSRPSRKEEDEEEEEDPVDAMVARTGCAAQHGALQECMGAQRDWRRCQEHVRALRDCMARHERELVKRKTQTVGLHSN